MPARDYQLVVSCFGNVFITKVSKRDKNVMLDDRYEVPVNIFYQIIEQFAKANIKEGFSTLEVKTMPGELVFEIRLPNSKAEAREKHARNQAITTLELTKGFTPEQREFINGQKNILDTMEELAGYILELTN